MRRPIFILPNSFHAVGVLGVWETLLNNSNEEPSSHATDVSLAEFCMEMFDDGK